MPKGMRKHMPPKKSKINLIAVSGIHATNSLQTVLKMLMPPINGYFEALGFFDITGMSKSVYVRLSPHLNANAVVMRIQQQTKFGAYKLDSLPKDLVLNKKGKIPLNLRLANRVSGTKIPSNLIYVSSLEIITEMQFKYTGLFNLHRKHGSQLIADLTSTVFNRMQAVFDKQPEAYTTGFLLTKAYRRVHPHFCDFQLILSTLHALQDAAGQPRAQITEHELTLMQAPTFEVDNVPYEKVQQACDKYSDKIVKKLSAHIASLSTVPTENETEEDAARRRVRVQIKKIDPYLPLMVKQVISSHFKPQKADIHRVTIYGEPFMPTKDIMQPFMKRFRPVKVQRIDRIFNQLRVCVPASTYSSIISKDGTVIGGATLVIRPSDLPKIKLSKAEAQAIRQGVGLDPVLDDEEYDEAMEE